MKLLIFRLTALSSLRCLLAKIWLAAIIGLCFGLNGVSALAAATSAEMQSLKGRVYIDAPLAQAEVIAKCAAQGKNVITKTDKVGNYAIRVSKAAWPCMLQVRGGYLDGAENILKLHTIAYQAGVSNITPVTDLSLAYVTSNFPEAFFERFPNAAALSASSVEQGFFYVKQQFSLNQLAAVPDDIFSEPMQDNDAHIMALNHLMEKIALSQHPWKNFVILAANKANWQGMLTPPLNAWKWDLPATLPEPLVPGNNPMSEGKVELGRYLFYDVRLSGNQKFSCASCHLQGKAFTDGKALAVGSTGQTHPRSSPSLGNVAYNARLTWADPTDQQLEQQINAPMFGKHPVEMGINDKNRQEVIGRIQSDSFYQAQFKRAFPGQDNVMRWENIKKSISAFQRTMLTGYSRYDRHLRREQGVTWSEAEENGYVLFFTSAKCFACHGSFNFNDTDTYKNGPPPDIRFHNTGLFNIGGTGAFPMRNRGIFEFTKKPSDMGKFRAPTLRNIAVTAPYMHDGSIPTLEKVLDFYAAHGRNIKSGSYAGDGRKNRFKSKDVNEINLTEKEKADIVAFLKTLTDEQFLKNPRLSDPYKKAP